ncbi:hypothetical protein BDY17DRAFT_325062 [Neohortaea acidophila]|uniref:Mitochondrial protein n=1 Tax=Neohortaea acidophila TaxID=245834 RepID=A0A6A6PRP7_9PEZI|nr:uncharacterized protein BDY17DRAFT_325062 [Neohortaea acidophila]KAF2482808.1 hypothetical protein BDY17DRAFT_325062 [Neohortaea acidophila]
MSKLSEPLKALINAAHAKPNTLPAPRNIRSVYEKIASNAAAKKVGMPAWLTASAAATFTMNSPESLLELYRLASSPTFKKSDTHGVYTAEFMREIGLKCIGLNGVPRTINCLGAFFAGLPQEIQSELLKRPARRSLNSANINDVVARGKWMWNDIYAPFSDKLTAKLAQSHPDMPVFIIEGEYGALFSNPPSSEIDTALRPNLGRVLTSVFAIAVLRAQTGVGPQVVSHVFGLRKAFDHGSAEAEGEVPVEGGKWLASDEGSVWLLEQVDEIIAALGGGEGSSFAPGHAARKEKARL